MAFIDNTYFKGEILIPNAANETSLTQAMAQYEKEVLISLLGYKLYSLLQADLDNGEPQTQKYIDLVNGAEFTHEFDGETYTLKWEGLKNTDLISLIAYYVYYQYVSRHIAEWHGNNISTTPSGKDWQMVSPMNKLCHAWDRMRTLYGKIPVDYKADFAYPVKGTNLDDVYDMEPSAYNFLYANKDDYPDWVFTPLWGVNQFGI